MPNKHKTAFDKINSTLTNVKWEDYVSSVLRSHSNPAMRSDYRQDLSNYWLDSERIYRWYGFELEKRPATMTGLLRLHFAYKENNIDNNSFDHKVTCKLTPLGRKYVRYLYHHDRKTMFLTQFLEGAGWVLGVVIMFILIFYLIHIHLTILTPLDAFLTLLIILAPKYSIILISYISPRDHKKDFIRFLDRNNAWSQFLGNDYSYMTSLLDKGIFGHGILF